MKTYKFLTRLVIVFLFLVTINACSKDDLEPATEQNKAVEGGIESDANLFGILKGAYSFMTQSDYYGQGLIINNEVRTENCFSNGNSGRYTTQASLTYNENSGGFWDEAYEVIATANIVIGVNADEMSGDADYIVHMQGQAYVMRALAHFDLLKQYGQHYVGGTLGIPYITEFKGDDLLPSRNSVTDCLSKINADLDTGFGMMDSNYDDSKEFINKYAAKAIKSSVAVYFGNWAEAITAAEAVINTGLYSIIPAGAYVNHFGGTEAANSIFELAFNATDNRGINGLAYIYRTTDGGSYGDVQVLDEVIDLYDADDVRAGILDYEGLMLRNIGKYPDNQGYDNVVVIRYEEVLLNYVEALFETGGDALTQLNLLAAERGIDAYTAVTKEIILDERRKEFIFEGQRFDDMRRNGMDLIKYSLQQNITASILSGDYRFAWPIPKAETDANSNIVQNSGY